MNISGCPEGYANDDWIDSRRLAIGGEIPKSAYCTLPIRPLEILCDVLIAIEVLAALLFLRTLVIHRKRRITVMSMGFSFLGSVAQIVFLSTQGVPSPMALVFLGLAFAFSEISMIFTVYEVVRVVPGMLAIKYEMDKDFAIRITLAAGMGCMFVLFLSWSLLAPIYFSDPEQREIFIRLGCAANAALSTFLSMIPFRALGILISAMEYLPGNSKSASLQVTKKRFAFGRASVFPIAFQTTSLWALIAALIPFYWYLVIFQVSGLTLIKLIICAMKAGQSIPKSSAPSTPIEVISSSQIKATVATTS